MRAAILLIVAAGALAALHLGGRLFPFIEADQTGIVLGLMALIGVCTALSRIWRKLIIWVIDHQICPTFGLLGTVIGFMATLEGVVGDITAAKLSGVETALVTTVTGLLAHIWLLIVREATRR